MTAPTALNVLLTGATGYIGGSVLNRLIQHPTKYQITTLIRSPAKAAKIKTIYPQLQTVLGSHAQLDLVRDLAASSDVVIATADIDNMRATQAILAGLKKRYEQVGVPPIFIHTSGIGCFMTENPNETHDDLNSEDFAKLPPSKMHRAVDLVIANADAEGYVRSYIILPTNVYGLASGPLVEAGVQNKVSIFLPALIKISLMRGQGGMIEGAEKQIHVHVHIDDCADLYVVLLGAILANNPLAGHGHDGYYICENGERNMLDVYRSIASALHVLKKGMSPAPTLFTRAQLVQYFGEYVVDSGYLKMHTRGTGNRSRGIGWKPVHSTQDLLDSALPEVKNVLDDAGVPY